MTSINYSDKNFLIIDNIKPSHDVLKKYALSITSKPIDSTYFAKDALSLCLEKKYDVILLGYDLGEKQKNGQQLLEELRVSEVISRHCIVIMITAEISQSMVLAALEHKPDSYLCKPYTTKELSKRLNNCLRKKEAMSEIYDALENDNKGLIIDLVNEALNKETPYRLECLGIKSRQFFDLKQYTEAKDIYLKNQNETNCTWAKIGLGKIALEENELSTAEEIFKEIVKQKPFYLPGYDWLATTYEKIYNSKSAEDILEHALRLSPRSVARVKKYANLCFENNHFEKATSAYKKVYDLAYNSIHHCPDNAFLFAKSLASYSSDLPITEAKKMNNKAFSMFSQVNKSFNQPEVRIQSYLFSAWLLENINDYIIANTKIELGIKLLEKEQINIDSNNLKSIAETLIKLKRHGKASQLLLSADQHPDDINISLDKIENTQTYQEESYAVRAQKALNIGKELYELNKLDESVASLTEALQLFPNHNGIKLNLLQVLLGTYENDKLRITEFKQAKKILIGLINVIKSRDEDYRFRKLKTKFQQLNTRR